MEKRNKNIGKNIGLYIIIIISCMGIGFLIGKTGIADKWKEIPFPIFMVRLVVIYLFFFLSALIHIVIHETGHMIAALLRGWKFLSFMIMGVVLSRREGRLHLSRFSMPGAGGQCLMLPPENGDTTWGIAFYNAGGVLANLLLTICSFIPLLTCYNSLSWATASFLICNAIVGFFLILMNGVPHNLAGIPNDGMNILKLHKDVFSSQIFLHTMQVMGYLMQNNEKPINNMPYQCDGKDIDPTNALHVMALSTDLSLAMSRMDFEKARVILKRIEPDKEQIIPIYRNEILLEKIFLTLIVPYKKADIEYLLEKPLLKYLKQQSAFRPSALRVQYALARLYELNSAKAERIYQQFQKVCRTYYLQGEVNSEKKLVEYVQQLSLA